MESDIFKALADPTRRSVFEKLAVGAMNASDLRRGIAISQPAMSQHLAVLRSAGLVRERRDGRFVNYEVDPEGLARIGQMARPLPGLLAAPRRRSQAALEGHGSMSDRASDRHEEAEIALEVELDAAPDKVWRAIAIAAFRERWLPEADLAEPEPIASIPGVEVRYRMREEGAPFPESTVTFRIEPRIEGGTLFRIIHRIEGDARRRSANDNLRPVSLAA